MPPHGLDRAATACSLVVTVVLSLVCRFPVLQSLFAHVLTLDNPMGHEFARQIVKTFFIATQLQIPPYLENPKVFGEWMPMLLTLYARAYPNNAYIKGQPLREIPLWKCKKWLGRIFTRCFTRYGTALRNRRRRPGLRAPDLVVILE
jgi:hypothetical protein